MVRRRRPNPWPPVLAVMATSLGVLLYPSLAPSSSSASAPPTLEAAGGPNPTGVAPALVAPDHGHRLLGEADGVVPDGVTVFDSDIAAVGRLDPALLSALRQAATDADEDGIDIVVNSGWRSPEYQQRLLDQAVSEYGSASEAARWVATPETSAHVSGDAADIGPSKAASWMSKHGEDYGLCRTYENEPWHFELRPDAVLQGCPRMYEDPTHDPRMHR